MKRQVTHHPARLVEFTDVLGVRLSIHTRAPHRIDNRVNGVLQIDWNAL